MLCHLCCFLAHVFSDWLGRRNYQDIKKVDAEVDPQYESDLKEVIERASMYSKRGPAAEP